MGSRKGVDQVRRHSGGDAGQGYTYYDDMTPAELKAQDDRVKKYDAIQARQAAYMEQRLAKAAARQQNKRAEHRGCVFAKSCKLPDAIISYTHLYGVVPTDSLSDYGHFAVLGARQADSSGLSSSASVVRNTWPILATA